MKDVIKDFADLPKGIRFDHPLNWSKDWHFCAGGGGRRDDQWAIVHTFPDLHQDVYPLPDYFNDIIRTNRYNAKEEALREVRMALGI